jgi:hypothetical protein
MRLWSSLTLLAFLATLAPSGDGRAKVNKPCLEVGRPCECLSPVRNCLPTCHIQPRLECASS